MEHDKMKDLIVAQAAKIVELEETVKTKERSSDFWFKKFHELEKKIEEESKEASTDEI
jgi:hypothetical protein